MLDIVTCLQHSCVSEEGASTLIMINTVGFKNKCANTAFTTAKFFAKHTLRNALCGSAGNKKSIAYDVNHNQRIIDLHKGDKRVKLYGMKHIAPTGFFERATQELEAYDKKDIIHEGVNFSDTATDHRVKKLSDNKKQITALYDDILNSIKSIADYPEVQRLGTQREFFTPFVCEDRSNVHDIVLDDYHSDDVKHELYATMELMHELRGILAVMARPEHEWGDVKTVRKALERIECISSGVDVLGGSRPLPYSSPVREKIAVDAILESTAEKIIVPWGNAHIAPIRDILVENGYRIDRDVKTKF